MGNKFRIRICTGNIPRYDLGSGGGGAVESFDNYLPAKRVVTSVNSGNEAIKIRKSKLRNVTVVLPYEHNAMKPGTQFSLDNHSNLLILRDQDDTE